MTNNYDPDGAARLNQSQVTLTNGQPDNLNQDFGYTARTPGSISGTLWNDVNAERRCSDAGEAGRFAGVTVDLYRDLNGNGRSIRASRRSARRPPTPSATTASPACPRRTTATAPGADYIVDVTDTAGVLAGCWHSLGLLARQQQPDRPVRGVDQQRRRRTTPPPTSATTSSRPAWATASGWTCNNNGMQDPGEPGIAGVKVTLHDRLAQQRRHRHVYDGDRRQRLLQLRQPAAGRGLRRRWDGRADLQPHGHKAAGLPARHRGWRVPTLRLDSNPHSNAPATTTKGSTNDTYDFNYIDNPTAVLLDNFQAVAQPDHVLVTWETVSEVSNGGFNLYRASTVDGERTLLANVPSLSPGGTAGAAYSYQDFDVQPGQTYWYYLEDVDLSGRATVHEPVSVEFPWATAVALRTLGATRDRRDAVAGRAGRPGADGGADGAGAAPPYEFLG